MTPSYSSHFAYESSQGIPFLFGQAESSRPGGGIGIFLPILIIIGITYFLVMRPQIRRQKLLEKKRRQLQKGDSVIAAGGLLAKVSHFKGEGDKIVVLELAEGLKVDVLRAAISDVVPKATHTATKPAPNTPSKKKSKKS